MNSPSCLALIRHPSAQPRSTVFQLEVNGEKIDALLAEKADFAVFECSGSVEIVVTGSDDATGAVVKPLSRGIVPVMSGDRSIRFQISGPQCLCVEFPGLKPFFIYANAPEEEKPSRDNPSVRYYAAGQIYQVGKLELKSGETLYIEAGAVVRGNIVCRDAHDVTICGQGILDGSYYDFSKKQHVQSIVFQNCRNVEVRDIVMIEPTSWMLVLAASTDIHVHGLKQIGSCMSSDGIDICGSQNVLIEDCCLRNDDDNIAIKSVTMGDNRVWEGNVEHVRVRRCVFFNGPPGNVMEIGYELRASHVRDIVFEDIDVIYAHGDGAVFSIHNGDRASVEDVRWENIRVEHYWDKLIDFRVVRSRYNKDTRRGLIRNIHLKNIHVAQSYFNPGCSISLISGFTADQPVRDVTIEDFYLNDKKVLVGDDIELHTRNAEAVKFL